MAYFGCDTYWRSATQIQLRVGLVPDSAGDYKITVTRGSDVKTWTVGDLQANESADKTSGFVFSNLSGNTSYDFFGQLYVRWSNDAEYTAGSATFSKSIMTYPDFALNPSATVNGDNLTIQWNQSLGGRASTIGNAIYIYSDSSFSNLVDSVGRFSISSSSNTKTIDVSDYSPGTYYYRITSFNAATDANDYDQPTNTYGIYSSGYSDGSFVIQAQTISGSITTSNATPSGTDATISFSFNNDSSSAYNMYYVIGVGTNSSSSASSYTYTHQSSATTKSTGTSTYSYTMPESGSQLTPGTLYYYRIEVYGKGSSDSSYTLLDSDTGSFTTTASAAAGTWSSGPTVTVSGSTINYSATWRQSSAGSTSWTFGVYLDDANVSARKYNQTATLTQNGTHNISGSIQNASEGEHRIYFNAKATGKDEWAYRDVTIAPSGAPTGSWTTSPSVTQTSGAMTAKCSAVVKRNDSISQSYYVRIRVINASNDSAVTTSSATSINQTGSVTLDYTTSALSSGAYTYSFIAEYSSSSSGPWTQLYTSSGSALYNDVTFAISDSSTPSTTPSGTWTAAPSVVQTENAMTATCSATVRRDDSVSRSFYVRIRVTDSSGNDISANCATVTDGLDLTSNGITAQEDSGLLKIYGTATANRQLCYLNGQSAMKTTTSSFSETLDAGTYVIETDMTGYQAQYSFRYTYTTFSDYVSFVNNNNKNVEITFTNPVMIGIMIVSGRDYGTSDNPTYVSFRARKKSDDSGISIASNETVSVSCTTGSLSAGVHTYTFTPEWRETTSQGWTELQSSTGNSIVRTATVTITDSGSPDPTLEPSGQTLYKWAWGTGTFFSQITPESTTSQRQQAYSVLTSGTTNQRATTNFNHTVWNDLITWITWSLDQLNVTYTASVASNAKMQSSPYTLTAAKWNSMRTLWNKLLTTGLGGSSSDQLSSVQSGDTVYGSMFTSLVSVMNDYIDDYNS